jgi:UDP-N-acetylmuramoyl-L-alanyl-D-glutamate--2,6-diaminopimelate ligase
MNIRPVAEAKRALIDFDAKIFNTDIKISGVAINAKEVKAGDLFIALPGAKTHGANFVAQAIANGAVAVLSEKKLEVDIPSFIHHAPRELVGLLSSWLYDQPFSKLSAVGITGTNGKTTTTNLLKQLWQLSGYSAALIGTLGVEIDKEFIAGERTTPEADQLQSLTALIVERKITHLAMEVSSHAIDQFRVEGCHYKVVAFTNLTQDHLDYHKSMDNYFAVKAKLFTAGYADSAILNIDDEYGVELTHKTKIPITTISRVNNTADWYYQSAVVQTGGYKIEIRNKSGEKILGNFPLLGDYNLDNLLLAVAIASATGLNSNQISDAISKLKSVPGRLEQIVVGQSFTALVDYAHTPDAVERVLQTAQSFTTGKVIAVLGCGGDRDSSKRAIMGKALFSGSDIAIFTSDNPRSESADEILNAMTKGVDLAEKGFVLADRKVAIDFAVKQAKRGDTVLILGKGHESGQDVGGVITPFDDRIELAESIKRVSK